MTQIKLKGNPINTIGELPNIGTKAKDFKLTKTDLSVSTLADYKGYKLILNIFPSLDTATCAASVRHFNKVASELKNTKVLCISRDLPFAQARFCGAEGLQNVITLSDYATGEFGRNYGLEITDGPLQKLHSRSIVIIDEESVVKYTQQVPETTEEPNYEEALSNL
jgi:thioredoxin-dependent peroxiredoxin